jgi:hypothetical protein
MLSVLASTNQRNSVVLAYVAYLTLTGVHLISTNMINKMQKIMAIILALQGFQADYLVNTAG